MVAVVAAQAQAVRRELRRLAWPAALAVLLGVAVVAQVRHERAALPPPLTALDPAAIHHIVLACAGCPAQEFAREAAGWRMLAPVAGPADPVRVEKLLAIARAPVRTRFARGELDPAKLGLVPPAAVLTLDGTRLAFGTTDAIQQDRYVAVDGEIALVPDRFSAVLFVAPEAAP